jgi:hypothetical protein
MLDSVHALTRDVNLCVKIFLDVRHKSGGIKLTLGGVWVDTEDP